MCVLPLNLVILREQGGEANGRSIKLFYYRINDITNHKCCLAMYNLHTMGK